MNLQIVYNLQQFTDTIFLPTTWLVKIDQSGQLFYPTQKVTTQNIHNQQLNYEPIHQRCMELVESLSVKALEKKYNKDKKVATPLSRLLDKKENKTVAESVKIFIDRQLDALLNLVVEHQLSLCFDIESKTIAHLTQLHFSEKNLLPRFAFRRNEQGIAYRLAFESDGKTWKIADKKVLPLVNSPAWLAVDNQFFRVADMNANLVVPFQKKDEVTIPASSAKEYFQKIILKVVEKVEDLEIEGFDILSYSEVQKATLKINHDFFQQLYGFNLIFDYGKSNFSFYESRKNAYLLDFQENTNVFIHKTSRNTTQENDFLTILKNLGLGENGNFLHITENITNENITKVRNLRNVETIINFLIENKNEILKNGIFIEKIDLEGKEIALEKHNLRLDVSTSNDWFDLKGAVQIGEFLIPFARFVNNLKTNNPLFKLPDGTHFYLPQEWFSKYQGIADFGKMQGDSLRFTKSQNALLENIGLLNLENQEFTKIDTKTIELPNLLKANLRPYQIDGFRWLIQHYENGLGACLADDMGLGKTLQTIAALLYAKEKAKTKKKEVSVASQLDFFAVRSDDDFLQPLHVLIVLPASLVFNWRSELAKFAPSLTVYEHTGAKRHQDMRLIRSFDVTLTTYQTASKDEELLSKLEWEYIVLDESHYIKNPDSQVFKSLNQLQARHKISLSGTPIENSLTDLWAQMQFINPGLLGGLRFFKENYQKPIEKAADEGKKQQLRLLVLPYLLRRTKGEVAKDLPDLTIQVVYVEMTTAQAKLYETEKSSARNLLLDYDEKDFAARQKVFNALTRLRQIVNHPKLVEPDFQGDSGKMEEILTYWESIAKAGHKMLIFSSFTKNLDLYKDFFKKENKQFSYLTGQVTADNRELEIKKFQQNADNQSFLISLKAGGTGLNLTEAEYVFITEPWWNPQAELQAIGRAHRIGQKKNVIAYKFITKNSIEEKILTLQERKIQIADDILGVSENMSLTKKDLQFLLE